MLSNENSLVLQAEPGAGKSTALPLSLIGSEWLDGKKIVMLEPRRVAAKSIAHYLARQLNESNGQSIGYHIKNDRRTPKNTVLEIVTEGILTRRLQSDPEISDVGLIIFDEFHERSIHADLGLLLALEIQQTIRDDLKILVMSATIDTVLISKYLGGAKIIKCPGTMFPVELEYTPRNTLSLPNKVANAVKTVVDNVATGDILIFLPGQSDIRKSIIATKQKLTNEDLEFLPLYGSLPLVEQENVLQVHSGEKRRVIFSTNIAETSLTINGITSVIDSGLEKVVVFDSSSGMTRLETQHISKASAEQRKGRAGRIQKGNCIRLWDAQHQASLKDYQDEEILSSDLSGFILELASWGSASYENINWLSRPPKSHFDVALQTLTNLKLMDENQKITAMGEKATGFGLAPRLSAMILRTNDIDEKSLACELAALLSERDILPRNSGVDIIHRILAIQDYKKSRTSALKNYPIKPSMIEQIRTNTQALLRSTNSKHSSDNFSLSATTQTIEKLMLYGYPDRLAKRRSKHCNRYLLANGKGAFLDKEDSLFGSEWLVVADCDGQKTEGRIYSAVKVSYETITHVLNTDFTNETHYTFDREKQKIIGSSVKKYQHLTLEKRSIAEMSPQLFQQYLLEVFPETGLSILNWTDSCEKWLKRAQWLGEKSKNFPKLSKHILIETIESWLIPYLANITSIKELRKIDTFNLLSNILSWEEHNTMEGQAPTHYQTPSGKSVMIDYDENQGPTVSVQLQEMFGQTTSPKIGGNSVPIRFELLSPARRPIQMTSDLNHFWKNSYFDVVKEMRGKYPKHRWPEKPLLEKPGRSIKAKK